MNDQTPTLLPNPQCLRRQVLAPLEKRLCLRAGTRYNGKNSKEAYAMRIVTLVENTSLSPDLEAEHGLSLLLEVNGRRLLFDMGQSPAFARNAHRLGVDLAAVDTAILSHGHYDHGGGLEEFLRQNAAAPVYLSPFAFESHLSGLKRDIGLSPALQTCGRLRYVSADTDLGDGLTLTPCAGAAPAVPIDPAGLFTCREGRLLPEDFRHEQYLIAEEAGRRVVFSGCSHRGILNIVRWLRPDVVVGGFHFKHLDLQREEHLAVLDDAARRLLDSGAVFYTCHCTGEAAYRFLKNRMADRLHPLSTGSILNL